MSALSLYTISLAFMLPSPPHKGKNKGGKTVILPTNSDLHIVLQLVGSFIDMSNFVHMNNWSLNFEWINVELFAN